MADGRQLFLALQCTLLIQDTVHGDKANSVAFVLCREFAFFEGSKYTEKCRIYRTFFSRVLCRKLCYDVSVVCSLQYWLFHCSSVACVS